MAGPGHLSVPGWVSIMTEKGYPWWKYEHDGSLKWYVDHGSIWEWDKEYRGYMTEGWDSLRNVTLTGSEVAMASRLNIPLETYARMKIQGQHDGR
jgi:hypothetical protein